MYPVGISQACCEDSVNHVRSETSWASRQLKLAPSTLLVMVSSSGKARNAVDDYKIPRILTKSGSATTVG
jgi:hypothetical protein